MESSRVLESTTELEYPLSQEEKKALSKTASEARGQKAIDAYIPHLKTPQPKLPNQLLAKHNTV